MLLSRKEKKILRKYLKISYLSLNELSGIEVEVMCS